MRVTRREVFGMALGAALGGCVRPEPRSPHLRARPGAAATTLPAGNLHRLGLHPRRDAWCYARPGVSAGPAPLLVYLHGARGGGRDIESLVPWADERGAILLGPDSREATWGAVSGEGLADVEFLDAALEKVFASALVDARHIGMAGFSDGATAALSHGLVNGALFRGIAAFSPGSMHVAAAPEGKPRVFISHGLRDPVFPVDRCGRRIAATVREAGYDVDYREFDGGHEIPADILRAGLGAVLG